MVIDYQKCVGCGTCEMICSLAHEGVCSPFLSRIKVVRQYKHGRHIPISCAFCEKPPCVAVCPVSAISKDSDSGFVGIDESKCIGCRQCVQACPFGHMGFNIDKGLAIKCDLCGGDPQCVKYCWTQALEYLPPLQYTAMKREKLTDRMIREADSAQ